MGELEKRQSLNESTLKRGEYFQSLLYEISIQNLLESSQILKIQLDLQSLLAKQVNKYTRGDSSSVTIEKAQQILQSICYCIGVYLKSLKGMETKMDMLKEEGLETLFLNGQELVRIYINKSKEFLEALKINSLKINNYAYNDTIFNGITNFFHEYDLYFAASDSPGSIDYPLSKDKMDLSGIEYIYEYLTHLTIENNFCRHFSNEAIENLLRGYDDCYNEILINIYELVLLNALGRTILGKDLSDLDITKEDRLLLQQTLEKYNKEALVTIINKTFDEICSELNFIEIEEIEYMKKSIIPFSYRLRQNLNLAKLEMVFITLKNKPNIEGCYYQDGKQMLDDKLRAIIDEIKECNLLSDKINLLQSNIKSLSDLIEILAECFFKDEFEQIFKLLNDIELGQLWKSVLQEQEISYNSFYNEDQWQSEFIKYVDRFDIQRQKHIKSYELK